YLHVPSSGGLTNLRAGTNVEPLSLQELARLSAGDSSIPKPIKEAEPLSYGSVLGSPGLRDRILSQYHSEDVPEQLSLTVTQGAIAANFIVLDTLLGPGDHVICQYPTYQQLYEVPRRVGADVSLWCTHAEKGWIPDLEDLSSLVRESTKMIIINNPNNPTGASIPQAVLEGLVSFATERNIIIFSDEVFRPLFHTESTPPSIISFAKQCKNIIAVSSLSKAYALPGIRIGWAISPNPEIMEQITLARDYTTLSVSQVDQDIATFALGLGKKDGPLGRSWEISSINLASLEKFIARYPNRLRWVKPTGASMAFVRIVEERTGLPLDDALYCEGLLKETGLLLVPGGKTFGTEGDNDFKGYIRVGFAVAPEKFERALQIWGKYLDRS
ncbi:aspartate aminotransferase, partial [Penicillium cataractarum]